MGLFSSLVQQRVRRHTLPSWRSNSAAPRFQRHVSLQPRPVLHTPSCLPEAGKSAHLPSSDPFAEFKRLRRVQTDPASGPLPVVHIDSVGSASYALMLAHLQACSRVAIDCEWSHEQLCLVQIHAPSTSTKSTKAPPRAKDSNYSKTDGSSKTGGSSDDYKAAVYMLDPLAVPEVMHSLESMLSNLGTLKVFHDCREDVSRLHHTCKVHVAPVLDTQVAHALLQNPHSGSALFLERPGSIPRISLEKLLSLHGFSHKHKKDVHARLKADPLKRLWLQRPLPTELLRYAAMDVQHLLTIAKRMGAFNNTSILHLSQFEADRYQDSPNGKPPPFVELEMKIGPGNVPAYYTLSPPLQAESQQKDTDPEPNSVTSPSAQPASLGVSNQEGVDEEATSVIKLLPERLQFAIMEKLQEGADENGGFGLSTLYEIHIDAERPVKLRFKDHPAVWLPLQVPVSEALVCLVKFRKEYYKSEAGLGFDYNGTSSGRSDGFEDGIGSTITSSSPAGTSFASLKSWRSLFGSDGRMGLPGTLHRICGMIQDGQVYALTYRVGRHKPGLAEVFSDLLAQMCNRQGSLSDHSSSPQAPQRPASRVPPITSILIVGRPGSGKTTLLRDVARLLASNMQKEAIVIDTSSEIAGDAFKPHPCIGNARRFLVPDRLQQHQILLEAVQNHGPDAIIVDEIGTKQEVAAVSTISQRGVAMIGTAHGHDLHSLLKNPVLVGLLGGIQAVIMSDDKAKEREGVKTQLERKDAPVFSTLIEVIDQNMWRVHPNVAESVDFALAYQNKAPNTQLRRLEGSRHLRIKFETPEAAQRAAGGMAEKSIAPPQVQS